MNKREKMRNASYLLPDPGGEVVRELLAEIEQLEITRSAQRERVAAFAHEQWSRWTRHLFSKAVDVGDGSVLILARDVERRRRQAETPYAKLSQAEKDSDRREADGYLAALVGDDEMSRQTTEQLMREELDRRYGDSLVVTCSREFLLGLARRIDAAEAGSA